MNKHNFNLEPFNFTKIITILKNYILLVILLIIIVSIFILAWCVCTEHTTNKDIINVLTGETKGAFLTKKCIRLNTNDNNLVYCLSSLLEDSRYFSDNKVCNIEFLNFPNKFNSVTDYKYKLMSKSIFIKMILPLIIKANKEVLSDRKKVLLLSAKMPKEDLSDQDMEVFKYLINKYDINLKINTPWDVLSGINLLLIKVNYIPNSLVLAVAIRETNWGSSKELKNYNSLFGEKEFYNVVYNNLKNNKKYYEFKKFENLNESIQSFFEKVNSKVDFSNFRNMRYKQLSSKNGINSLKLANSLDDTIDQSKKMIRLESIIKNNNLIAFDKYNDVILDKKPICIYFR